MRTLLKEYCEAKPAWAATPRLPFVAVFPGKDIDTDVINNENLNRKYRQSRWLKSPLATKKLSDITSASGKNETLRLKRENPLKRNQNNLETALGLIIKNKT